MSGFGRRRTKNSRRTPLKRYFVSEDTMSDLELELNPPPKKTKRKPKKNSKRTPQKNIETIELNSDDNMDKDVEIDENNVCRIKVKVNGFFQSLISDSEDEEDPKEGVQTEDVSKTKPSLPDKPKDSNFYILSDSDDDVSIPVNKYIQPSKSVAANVENCVPSTSSANDSIEEIVNKNKLNTIDDILDLVDSIVPSNKKEENKTEENKEESWAQMLKETETMLKNVSELVGLNTEQVKKQEPKPKLPEKVTHTCPICFEVLGGNKEASASICGHIFCKECINTVIKSTNKKCPTCRKPLNAKKIHPLYI